MEYFNLLCFCGSFRAVEGIFEHRIVRQSGDPCCIYFLHHLFPNGFRIPSGTCLILFQPDRLQPSAKKTLKKCNFTDFEF